MRQRGPILVVLLAAFALLVIRLDRLPPGLTHDEAAHGWEALQILDGRPQYYFPLGYGREPFYAYLLAAVMRLVGISPFTLRLLVPWVMAAALAGSYAWGRHVLGRPAALLGAAAWAAGFWPLVAGRQALRSGLVPLLMVLVALGTWRLLFFDHSNRQRSWTAIALIAAATGLMLHTYIAARVLWVVPILFLPALWLSGRPAGGASARLLVLAVGLGLALGAPLLLYLQLNPGLESRLDMLSRPLTALLVGDIMPLARNSWAAILALVWPGRGDQFLAYNIPGRPTLEAAAAVLAVIGLGMALWRWRRPGHLYLILWLLIGLTPSLITGPTANTTRNIGALPALYLLVGLGGWGLLNRLPAGFWRPVLGVVLIGAIAGQSIRDYFGVWQNSPDVRAAYQASIVAALREIEADFAAETPLVISSVQPGPAHDPLIGDLVLGGEARPVRWVDARRALLFPRGESVDLLAPSSADLHPSFAAWAVEIERIELPASDLDPWITHYRLDSPEPVQAPDPVTFDGAITLVDTRWLAVGIPPGGVGELLTIWRVDDPAVLPQTDPPGFLDLAFFVHVLDSEGEIVMQEDRLDAPPATWEAGDWLVQIHQVAAPPAAATGRYEVRLGLYDRATQRRLPVGDGRDAVALPPLIIR